MEKETVQKTNGMPKQTFAFIAFLVVVTLVLLGLAVYTQNPNLNLTPNLNTTSIYPTYAHTVLRLTPPKRSSPLANSYSTDVSITTNKDKITATQLELTYDPKLITNVDVKIGDFIQNPVVLLKKVDQQTGRISLALGINPSQKPKSGEGTVATITFNEVLGATGSTIINFLPKTQVTAAGVSESVLKESFGSLFFVNQKESGVPLVQK